MDIKNRYIIESCSRVSNCQATMWHGKPFILFNGDFLEHVKTLGFTNGTIPKGNVTEVDWKALTILAHELGHHQNMHLINPDPNMSKVDMELEADEFAGHMMHLLGATLAQAQAVMYDPTVPLLRTYTHPGRDERMAAIKRGWDKVNGAIPQSDINPPIPMFPKIENDAFVKKQLDSVSSYFFRPLDTDQRKFFRGFSILKKYCYHHLFSSSNQCYLGMYYTIGCAGVPKKYSEAIKWYRKSADQGDQFGQLELAEIYERGEGVDKDLNFAKELYKKSAKQGNHMAQLSCKSLGITW